MPIIIISGNRDEGIIEESYKNGAYDYIYKADIADSTLSNAIVSAIEHNKQKEVDDNKTH